MAAALQRASGVDTNSEALLQQTLGECEEKAARLNDLLRLADALIQVLPPERRAGYVESVARFRTVTKPPRPAALNDNIVSIIKEKQQVTAAEVRDNLTEQGIAADHKQVNNSLDYLARRGDIQRIAPGLYKYDPAAVALAVEQMLIESYGPATHRGHPASGHLPEDY